MCSAKKVDMILVHAHRLHLDLISLLYARSRLFDNLDNLFVKKGFPVLDGENDVIMNLPCTMVPFSDSTFIVHLCSITKTPCSKLQGTFKLDTSTAFWSGFFPLAIAWGTQNRNEPLTLTTSTFAL